MDNTAIKTNVDTGLLKIIAFSTMLIDHAGYLFFRQYEIFRIIGRIAFPLFAYCLVLGFIHTRNVKKYFIRLGIFAAASQIPYTLCLFPNDNFNNFHLNIGFTMILGLYSVMGIKEKKYYLTALALAFSLFPQVEYGFYGVLLMTAMYIFIFEDKGAFAFVVGICLAYPAVGYFTAGYFDIQAWALLALPFMLLQTKSGIKIPRWVNYGFYPAHLLLLWMIDKFVI